MAIDITKKYRTRCGYPVKIVASNLSGKCPILFVYTRDDGYVDSTTCDLNGIVYSGSRESEYDLIEVSPYADFKIDDKVLVRNENTASWKKRYFAGVSADGNPLTFNDGATSWSHDVKNYIKNSIIEWNECIKYEEDNNGD